MKVTVKLFAYFRDNRFVAEVRDYPENTVVVDIVDALQIDQEEIGILLINSKHCQFDSILHENDVLAIFPVVGGG